MTNELREAAEAAKSLADEALTFGPRLELFDAVVEISRVLSAALAAAPSASPAAAAVAGEPTTRAGWLHLIDMKTSDAWQAGYERGLAAASTSPAAAAVAGIDHRLHEWAVTCWREQVEHRPLVNIHRRTLDGVWRQVIRFAGGDPDSVIGPPHDALAAAPSSMTPSDVSLSRRYARECLRQQMQPVYDAFGVTHGLNCPKAPHTHGGELHDENDDTPYDIDGVRYCGRCHRSL